MGNVLRRVLRLYGSIPKQIIGDDHGNIPKLALVPEFLLDLDALSFGGPMQAPPPVEKDNTAYVYPAYVLWQNDPSYMSFLGSPDRLELPKDVLRKTGGHPQSHLRQGLDYRLKPRHGWTI